MRFSPSVSLLATELYSTNGGVQAYMRRLAEILSEYNSTRGSGFDCMSLLDDRPDHRRHPRAVVYRNFIGSGQNKLRFGLEAIRLSYQHRPGTIVIGHPGLAPIGWVIEKIGSTRSCVVVVHGVEAWKTMDWSDRHSVKHAAAVVTTTRFTACEFSRFNGFPLDKTHVIPLAISATDIGDAAAPVSRPTDLLNVLTVTRMTANDGYKGVDTLIDAVARARFQNTAIRLRIAGTGDEVDSLRKRAAMWNLDGSVTFEGEVSDQTLDRLYRECDVFALPSKGEGFGIVFLEAMRHGKPCIGGNHGGTPEVIEHGATGYLVEHGDVEQLAASFVQLFRSPDLRMQLGITARRHVEARYLYTHMRQAWFSLLDQVTTFEH